MDKMDAKKYALEMGVMTILKKMSKSE